MMGASVADSVSLDSHISMQPNFLTPGGATRRHVNLPIPLEDRPPCRGNITPQIIECIEADLDFYDKVSLVFLLYEDVDVALQRLKAAELAERVGSMCSPDLLSAWARTQTSDRFWEDKFLEALCITQNYEVVEKLGYKKYDVTERFLPENPETALTVDLMRKSLYVVCEKLTRDDCKTLIHLVNQEMECEFPSLNGHEPEFLEMHLLFWMSQKRIVLENTVVDVKILTKHLKVMEKYNLIEYLDNISKRYRSHASPCQDDAMSESSGVFSTSAENHSVVSTSYSSEGISESKCYHIDPKNVGICLIINQKNFTRDPDPKLRKYLSTDELDDRIGTDLDKERLIDAFFNFGFKVQAWDNLSHTEMIEAIATTVKKIVQDNHSCFVLCVLSHGIQNAIYGCNSIAVPVDELTKPLQGKYCPKLLGKPKIFIFQACQGKITQKAIPVLNDVETDGPSQSHQYLSGFSDSFYWWSTINGYTSFRNSTTGSWFIQVLCDHLLASQEDVNIVDVAIAVNNVLHKKSAILDGERKCMQPRFEVTLSKHLVLRCNPEGRKKVVERMFYRRLFDTMLNEYLEREYHELKDDPSKRKSTCK